MSQKKVFILQFTSFTLFYRHFTYFLLSLNNNSKDFSNFCCLVKSRWILPFWRLPDTNKQTNRQKTERTWNFGLSWRSVFSFCIFIAVRTRKHWNRKTTLYSCYDFRYLNVTWDTAIVQCKQTISLYNRFLRYKGNYLLCNNIKYTNFV